MIENQPKLGQPHHQDYIKDHWNEVKDLEFKELKLVVIQNCKSLTKEEEKHFSTWLRNQRTSRKRQAERQERKEVDSSSISYTKQTNQTSIQEQKNAQIYVDQARDIFTQLARIKPEERYDFCLSRFDGNQLLFMKFMKECQRLPTPDFLDIVIQICENTQSQLSQTQLFIRACALFKDGLLCVPEMLVLNGLTYLAFEIHDSEAAQGLLKLAYYNDVSFKPFPLDALLEFQRKYSLEFQCFYNHLGAEVDSQVVTCLPPTCFLFTKPFYASLKQSGSDLHQMIDPEYLSFIIEILSYSFEDDIALFSEFLMLFKEINSYAFGRIDLKDILIGIHHEEIIRNPLFFGTLKNHILLFKHLFEQLKEKRITSLDDNIITELLQVNEEQYLLQNKCPRIVNTIDEAENRLMAFWQHFYASNKTEIPSTFYPQVPDCALLKKMLSLFKINCLNPPQMIAFQLMKNQFQQKRLFHQLPTGIGKTTLSLIWTMYCLLNFKIRTISCYNSLELCEHDYGKLFKTASALYPSMALISNEEHLQTFERADIIFVTTDNLVKLMNHPFVQQELSSFQLILDEFDRSLFDCDLFDDDGPNDFGAVINAFIQFHYLVAFTGSPLEIIHKTVITNHLAGSALIYPAFAASEGENICQGISVLPTRPKHISAIAHLCENQVAKTPVVVIIDDKGFKTLEKQLIIAKIPFKNLSTANPSEISSFFFSVLTVPQNGKYAVTLLNTKQGRGLDIPTSTAIENGGGIYVVIGVLPRSFREFEQFKGRTRRMGNKGQHSVIIWDDTSLDAEFFLKEKLNTASELELQQLARQYVSIKALPLIGSSSSGAELNKLELEQNVENKGPKDVIMVDENVKNDQNKNNEEKSVELSDRDEDYHVSDKLAQRNPEECKVVLTRSKTLGKCKRKHGETKKIQLSGNKRIQKQSEKKVEVKSQEKENRQPLTEQKAYVRVNEALKIVIPSNELQEFKEQDFNKDVLAKNQQQRQKKPHIKAQQSSPPNKRQQIIANKHRNKQREQIDESYFAGYSELDIHTEMLNDVVRVEQYTKAINETCKDKVILDLGCGTGVLSVLAIKAGALKVYAVDGTNIETIMSEEFKKLIKEGKIEFINCTIEKLAEEQASKIPEVDVIVSEWMGYFLIFENMISSYICAIKAFLKPEGIVLPSHATMYLDAASYNIDDKLPQKHFKPNNHCKVVLIEQCKANELLSDDPTSIKTFDFTDRGLQNPLDNDGFTYNFEIQVAKGGIFNAFVGSFDTKLCEGVFLNTMPICPETHWKQSIFYITKPIEVQIGDIIGGQVHVKADEHNYRNLIVKFTYKIEGKEDSKAEDFFTFE